MARLENPRSRGTRWGLTALYGLNNLRRAWLRPITLGVRVLLVQERQVVLVRHSYTPGWYLPGGGVARGETVEQAARREVAEECGIQRLGALALLGVYDQFRRYKYDHVVAFVGLDFSEPLGSDSLEIEAVGRFPLDALPRGTTPATQRRIAEYLDPAMGVTLDSW